MDPALSSLEEGWNENIINNSILLKLAKGTSFWHVLLYGISSKDERFLCQKCSSTAVLTGAHLRIPHCHFPIEDAKLSHQNERTLKRSWWSEISDKRTLVKVNRPRKHAGKSQWDWGDTRRCLPSPIVWKELESPEGKWLEKSGEMEQSLWA